MFHHISEHLDISHRIGLMDTTDSSNRQPHASHEIILFVKGDCLFQIENEKRELKGGDIILIKPGEQYFISTEDDGQIECFILKFSDRILEQRFSQRIGNCLSFFPKNNFFESLIRQLDYYHKLFSDEDFSHYAKCKIWEILLFLIKASELSEPIDDETKNLMRSIIEYIKMHLMEDISIKDIAKHVKLSESYTRTLFKENMNVPIMKYIRSKKIFLAKDMITNGEHPSEVAKKLCFCDYSTFYRAYIKITGNTPNDDFDRFSQ